MLLSHVREGIYSTTVGQHEHQESGLLDALSKYLDIIGTKKGCNHGKCGACTVLVDGQPWNEAGVAPEAYKIFNSRGEAMKIIFTP